MPKKTTTEEPAKAILGSGNVFADLGLENPEELLAKAELVRHINSVIDKRGYTQKELATHLGIHQPQVSLLTSRSVKQLFPGALAAFYRPARRPGGYPHRSERPSGAGDSSDLRVRAVEGSLLRSVRVAGFETHTAPKRR